MKLPTERRFMFRYEDLVHDPKPHLLRLADALEVAPDAEWLRNAIKIPEHRPSKVKTLSLSAQNDLEQWVQDANVFSDRCYAASISYPCVSDLKSSVAKNNRRKAPIVF